MFFKSSEMFDNRKAYLIWRNFEKNACKKNESHGEKQLCLHLIATTHLVEVFRAYHDVNE